MSRDADEYQRQAEHCQERAEQACSAEVKAKWLQLASDWLSLIKPNKEREQNARFEAAVRKSGTKQTDSSSSH